MGLSWLEILFGTATVVGTGYAAWAFHRTPPPLSPLEQKQADAAGKAMSAVTGMSSFLKQMARGVCWGGQTLGDRWEPIREIEGTYNTAWDDVKTYLGNGSDGDTALFELHRKKAQLWARQLASEQDETMRSISYGDHIVDEVEALRKAAEDILGPVARHEKPKREPKFTEDEIVGALGIVALIACILIKECS